MSWKVRFTHEYKSEFSGGDTNLTHEINGHQQIGEVIEHFKHFLLGMGYHPNNVNEYLEQEEENLYLHQKLTVAKDIIAEALEVMEELNKSLNENVDMTEGSYLRELTKSLFHRLKQWEMSDD